MNDFEALLASNETAQRDVHTLADCQQAARALAGAARTTIRIVSRELDPRIYDDADFVSAVRQCLIGSNRARLEVLVRNAEPVVRNDHRLLSLGHRLTSFCEFRILGRDHQNYNSAFILVDGRNGLHRPLADRFEGVFSAHNRIAAKELVHQFDEMWDTGLVDPNLRRLPAI